MSGTSDGEPPIELIADSGAEDVVEPPPSPIYQPAVSTNQVRLPVDQFKEYMADLAVHAFTVRHDLTQAAIADLPRLSSFAIKYRTPYLMDRFIDQSFNLETRLVDCCINGCVAFTHARAQHATCTDCGAARYTADGKPADQITYRSLIAWLTELLGDPVIGKSMLKNMAAARTASEKGADGVHDYPHGSNYRPYRDKGLLDGGPFVLMNCGTDGFQFFRQNGFEGWPVTAT